MNEINKLYDEVKKGSIAAAYRLAEALKWGYYGEISFRKAARMYRICCRSKDKRIAALGYYNLGLLYYHGYLDDEPAVGYARAFAYFMKSALTCATEDALLKLGDMYRYGQHVARDEKRATGLYLMANRTA